MSYRILPPHLHATADAAVQYFRKNHGVTHVAVEAEIDRDIRYRPTLTGQMRDAHLLAVEVTDGRYTDALDAFVLDCERLALPVKLVVAIPRGTTPPEFNDMLRKARRSGVGILEVDSNGGNTFCSPLSLSLSGVRRIQMTRFPAKYRQALAEAEETFLNGDPAKGCGRVYDELEGLSRSVAKRVARRGLWKALKPGESRPKVNLEVGPWSDVLELLRDHLAFGSVPAGKPRLSPSLIAKVIGITPHRNDSGHKPRKRAQLIKRDRELRTRFEHAVDTLEEFIRATASLRP